MAGGEVLVGIRFVHLWQGLQRRRHGATQGRTVNGVAGIVELEDELEPVPSHTRR